ncbi:MAG: lipase family protein, partial [Pyrinomonadaceae bacterium]|nr:lipase family protein [Pyrinomonadaceae bacterium]
KITYTSLDAKGRPANLTGLVAWPLSGAPKGLVVYCHGTTVDRDRSPSRFKPGSEEAETLAAITGFTGGGYAVVLPDYIGLGDHKAAHPYPLSKVNARSGVDIIPAARALARQKSYNIGQNLFITGYSEGGGVAMALTQALQAYTGRQYRVTASAPAAGPYDLSGVTRKSMLEDTGEQVPFILRIYLTSYAVNFLVNEKGMRWRDFYRNTLATDLALKYRSGPTDDGLIKNIGIITTLTRSENRLSNVLQPDFLRAMQRNDRRNAFVRILQENNVYNWTPRNPMLLLAIDGDTVVSQENTAVAYNTMRKRGVSRDILRRKLIRDPELNHLNGIPPAMSFARAFFDEGFKGVRDLEQ